MIICVNKLSFDDSTDKLKSFVHTLTENLPTNRRLPKDILDAKLNKLVDDVITASDPENYLNSLIELNCDELDDVQEGMALLSLLPA